MKGDIFEGTLVNGLREGQGKLRNKDGFLEYEG